MFRVGFETSFTVGDGDAVFSDLLDVDLVDICFLTVGCNDCEHPRTGFADRFKNK